MVKKGAGKEKEKEEIQRAESCPEEEEDVHQNKDKVHGNADEMENSLKRDTSTDTKKILDGIPENKDTIEHFPANTETPAGSTKNTPTLEGSQQNAEDFEGSPENTPSYSLTHSIRKNSTSLVSICTLCIVLAAVVALYYGSTKPKQMSWEEAQNKFWSDFTEIQRKLNNQTLETYDQIFSSILSTLEEETPRQPSSLVFLIPPTVQNEFGSCLAREIGQGVNQIFQNVSNLEYTPEVLELGPEYFNDETISISDIHEKLIEYLKEGKFVIINNPQEVKEKERIMIFHAFCDNSLAPEKRATFIFVIPVPELIYERFEWKASNALTIADKILDSSWLTVDPSKRPATITRVAPSAVLLNPGDSC
jgi:hypothetical protein